MAMERFDNDLNIIAGLGDDPKRDDGLSTQGFKSIFDKAGLLIQDFINNKLIPYIEKQNVGLPLGGGTMEGPINMNGQKLTGLNAPTADDEPATKGYADLAVKKADPRNLLDNSDFRNPVNQRGQTRYSEVGYTIDRWRSTTEGGTVTVTDNAIEVGGTVLRQLLTLKPGVYTLAVKVDGIIKTQISRFDGSSWVPIDETNSTFTGCYIGLYFYEYVMVQVSVSAGYNYPIEWAALYEGEYTKETLPEYQPKGYGVELLECQRYYLVPNNEPLGCGYINGAKTIAYIAIPVPVKMRTTPTVSYGSIYVKYGGKQLQSTDDVTVYKNGANAVTIQIAGTYELASEIAGAFAYTFTLSADL